MVAKNTSKKNDPLSNVVDFPDLPPRGSKSWGGGKRSLLGPEIGTQFDWGQRLFAYYGEGDVFDYGLR